MIELGNTLIDKAKLLSPTIGRCFRSSTRARTFPPIHRHRAGRRLERLIGSRPVTFRGRERDNYGRLIAVFDVQGRELNATLVAT